MTLCGSHKRTAPTRRRAPYPLNGGAQLKIATREPLVKLWSSFVLSLLLSVTGTSQVTPLANIHWRTTESATVNAVFMLARAYGAHLDYSGLCRIADNRKERGASGRGMITECREIAGEACVRLGVWKEKFHELESGRFPAACHLEIVDLEGVKIEQIVLVYEIGKNNRDVSCFNAATGLHEKINLQDWIRLWSGFVVRPVENRRLQIVAWAAIVALLFGVCVTLVRSRG